MAAVAMLEATTSLSLVTAARALEDALFGLDARLLSGEDAAKGVEVLSRTEKICAAKRAQLASRATECGAHRDAGFSRPTDWLAKHTGSSAGAARRDLELASRLDEHPETKAALESGQVSLDEADEVVKTEESCPGTEHEMLDEARRKGLAAAKEKGRRIRQGAIDVEELDRQRHQARSLRTWTDELGMVNLCARMFPELGTRFLSRLQAETEREWKRGNREATYEQRAHDAFVHMLEGKGKGPARGSELVAVINVNEGAAHIPGVGPITMRSAADIAKDALVTVVLHDGKKIDAYRRFGPHIPAELLTLLEIGDPPDFDGVKCVDCGGRFRYQIDHVDPRANGGPTCHDNLKPRCPPCHREKTERDREAGLLGPKVRREGRPDRGPP